MQLMEEGKATALPLLFQLKEGLRKDMTVLASVVNQLSSTTRRKDFLDSLLAVKARRYSDLPVLADEATGATTGAHPSCLSYDAQVIQGADNSSLAAYCRKIEDSQYQLLKALITVAPHELLDLKQVRAMVDQHAKLCHILDRSLSTGDIQGFVL